ncbi:M15 family metallopeptidase [bacterium]|nr:M15 family metallopeptidase [bacterium]MBU1063399.1 M15 family metallopeptidase [bacterium]MBU1872203.1 M15 family metallopeptidase [bacterium]
MKRNVFSVRPVFTLLLLLAVFGCQSRPTHDLVELNRVIPDIVLDIRYAGTDNFVGEVLYPSARCFLAKKPAKALKKVQADLKQQGYCLKVFDGYRPLSVQRRMWEILPDDRYVADPATGSNHNRAYSVDVALLDLEGNEVSMPSEFDDFSERAHMDYMDCSAEAIHHRQILRETMERHGFSGIDSEWWHFNYQGYKDKPVLDISIDRL